MYFSVLVSQPARALRFKTAQQLVGRALDQAQKGDGKPGADHTRG
jgi:hypothetical protein